MYKNNNGGKIGIIITALILVVLVIFSNINNGIWGKIISPFTSVTRIIQYGYLTISNKISKNDDYFITLDSAKVEIEKLSSENEELKKKNIEIEALKAENRTMKEYMGIVEQYKDFDGIPGYVIQKDFSNYSKVLVINVGANDGITNGMTVVAEEGLVGTIVSVEANSSKVETIVDTANAISCSIANTEKTLVARGIIDSNDKVKGNYIDNDVSVNEGDIITTSGIGGVYPKNITVGRVSEIVNTKNKTNRYVYIKTNVDFNNLSSVLVIK